MLEFSVPIHVSKVSYSGESQSSDARRKVDRPTEDVQPFFPLKGRFDVFQGSLIVLIESCDEPQNLWKRGRSGPRFEHQRGRRRVWRQHGSETQNISTRCGMLNKSSELTFPDHRCNSEVSRPQRSNHRTTR